MLPMKCNGSPSPAFDAPINVHDYPTRPESCPRISGHNSALNRSTDTSAFTTHGQIVELGERRTRIY